MSRTQSSQQFPQIRIDRSQRYLRLVEGHGCTDEQLVFVLLHLLQLRYPPQMHDRRQVVQLLGYPDSYIRCAGH